MASSFALAKERIVDDLEPLVRELLRGRDRDKKRGTWNVVNPFRPGAKASQMIVWLQAPRRGAWKDFVSGDKGDAIDLVAYALEGSVNDGSRKRAVDWAFDRYGLRRMSAEDRERIVAEGRSRKLAQEAAAAERMQRERERARKFFYSCEAEILGTPVEAYLHGRGVDLAAVPHRGRSLRFHPDCEHWMLPGRPRFPAMVAAMVDAGGRLGACHYTFLAPDGRGKLKLSSAPDLKAKLMFPSSKHLVIRLTDGESGLSAEKAAAAGHAGLLALCEGIEDGLSIALASPALRVWAAGSLSALADVADHGCASAFLVFQDNDWGKPQAQAQFQKAVARLRRFRKPVEVISMPGNWGKDVNDALNSG